MMIKGVDYSATELREMIRRYLVDLGYVPQGNWYFLKGEAGVGVRVNPSCSYGFNSSTMAGDEYVILHFNAIINTSGSGIIGYKVDSAETLEEIMDYLKRISEAKDVKEKLIALYTNLEDLIQVAQL